MRPSLSAYYKWMALWPDKDINWEFACARCPGKKAKRQIEQQCPSRIHEIRTWRGTYRLIAPCGAVFVVARGEFIVDVFPLENAERFTAHMKKGAIQHYSAREIPRP